MEYMDGSHFLWIGVRLILPLLRCRIEPPPASQSCCLHGMHAIIEQSRKEVIQMFKQKMKLMLSDEDVHILIESLINLRNELLREGRYTDAVDDIILRLYR